MKERPFDQESQVKRHCRLLTLFKAVLKGWLQEGLPEESLQPTYERQA